MTNQRQLTPSQPLIPQVTPRQPSPPTKRRRISPFVLASLAVLLVLAAFPLLGRFQGDSASMPAELLGEWSTTDSRYIGRTLVFKADSVVFRAGDAGAAGYRVKHVRRRSRDAVTEDFLIRYDNDGEDGFLTFQYRILQGIIELENPDDVLWTRSA